MFVVARPNGTWEARESYRTARGPRSRTLATFRELTGEVADQVIERSSKPVDRDELQVKATRAGAPVVTTEVDRSAETLLRQMHFGRQPRKGLVRLLRDDFGADQPPVEHAVDRMKMWAGATKRERAEALVELLDVGDALPRGRRADKIGFPRIRSDS